MSYDLSDLKIIVYGRNRDKIDNICSYNKKYNCQVVILDNKITEDRLLSMFLFESAHMIFINADTMKPARIVGTDDIKRIIIKTENKAGIKHDSPYVIFFNRYLDSNLQTHYLGELDFESHVSLFESFNPGNSDAFYLSKKCVSFLRLSFPNPLEYKSNIKKSLFTYIRDGSVDAYSFNPNLYVFRLEDSPLDFNDQYFKSSIITYDSIMESRRLSKNIALFFSDHIILFWIFIVFFICTMLILFLRILKIGSYFL